MTARPRDDDGYRLWLRYEPIGDPDLLAQARAACALVFMPGTALETLAAARDELAQGLGGLLGHPVRFTQNAAEATLWVGTDDLLGFGYGADETPGHPLYAIAHKGTDAFVIDWLTVGARRVLFVSSRSFAGVLYGVFRLLRHLQTGRAFDGIATADGPNPGLRMLDHWDNLDGSVERGYAGRSLWRWDELPATISPRYRDYARANASIGINAVVLNNVNASAEILTSPYLFKVAVLANVFRPFGIQIFLSTRFSAPIDLGALATADPLDPAVAAWWRAKAEEIRGLVPDFGGFLVKANSEGQPGPQDYGRTHADGANMLARAVGPFARVLWRAFVYRPDVAEDRAKQAYTELAPLDGAFESGVILQVKNGPIDFQPREPIHPLFGAMLRTALALELQITQEYLGQGTHLAYLAPLFKEVLDADTHAYGRGWFVWRRVRIIVSASDRAVIAGVANIGDDRNWCGHPFAQANWYAFGRVAWDHGLSAAEIADEWLRMTFSHDDRFVAPIKVMMLGSREAVVDYMTPLGLHQIMAEGHHHGPGPWVDLAETGRADWTSVYYHRADPDGVGFDRTATGSDAIALYRSPLREQLADPKTCPENLLLWFHHLPWEHSLASSGRTLWDELCHRYSAGVDAVRRMGATWDAAAPFVDAARHQHVRRLLGVQLQEARWWRNACLLYFQTFSRRPLPAGLEPLEGTLEAYQQIRA